MQDLGKSQKIVIGMVGLPARGKTYISRKINRYLNWLGFKSRVFNIGHYRRQICGVECDKQFFDSKNDKLQALQARNQCAILALNDMMNFLNNGGDSQVSLYDGTNTTVERRMLVMKFTKTLHQNFKDIQVFWVESICNDKDVIQKNIKLTKLNNPDYLHMDSNQVSQKTLILYDRPRRTFQDAFLCMSRYTSRYKMTRICRTLNLSISAKMYQKLFIMNILDNHTQCLWLLVIEGDLLLDESPHLPEANLLFQAWRESFQC